MEVGDDLPAEAWGRGVSGSGVGWQVGPAWQWESVGAGAGGAGARGWARPAAAMQGRL